MLNSVEVQGYFAFNLCYLVHSNTQNSSGEFTYMFLSRLICLHLQCLSSFSSSSSSSTGTSPAKTNLSTRMSCRIPVRIFQDMVSSWLNLRDIRCMMIRPSSENQPIGTTIAIMPIRTTLGKQLVIITQQNRPIRTMKVGQAIRILSLMHPSSTIT